MRKGGGFAFGGLIEIVGEKHKTASGGLRNLTLDRKFLVQVGKKISERPLVGSSYPPSSRQESNWLVYFTHFSGCSPPPPCKVRTSLTLQGIPFQMRYRISENEDWGFSPPDNPHEPSLSL